MKAKISKILISICLIFTFCFFFTGCGDNDDNQGVLQLNTKYYKEGSQYIQYFMFTSDTKGYTYIRQKNSTTEDIDNFIWEYVAEDAICYTFVSSDNKSFSSLIACVGKNFFVGESGDVYIAENYLIKNNIPYLK